MHWGRSPSSERLLSSLFLFFLFGFSPNLKSQILPFQRYETKDGIVSNWITSLYQDTRGYLWIGTRGGLSIFDGRKFTNFTSANGLPVDGVNCLLEDRTNRGTMWIGTDGGGVGEYSNDRFQVHQVGTSIYTNRVRTMYQDKEGVIWCGTDIGLSLLEHGILKPFPQGDTLGYMYDIAEVGDSLLFFASYDGLFVFDRRVETLEKLSLGMATSPTALLVDSEGDLWIGTYHGIILRMRGTRVVERLSVNAIGVYFLLEDDRERVVWGGDHAGVFKIRRDAIRKQRITRITSANGLQTDGITAGLMDREHNLWLGSWKAGVSKLPEGRIFSFPIEWYGVIPSEQSVIADRRDHIFVAMWRGVWEVWRDEDNQWRQFQHRISFEDESPPRLSKEYFPLSSAIDRQGNLLILFKDKGVRSYQVVSSASSSASILTPLKKFAPPSAKQTTSGMYVDRDDRVWYSLWRSGTFLFDPRRTSHPLRAYSSEQGNLIHSIRTFHRDTRGTLWLGSLEEGVFEVRSLAESRESIRRWHQGNGLPDDQIRSLCEDHEGRIWVGTRQGGIAIIDGETVEVLSVRDGLPSNEVRSLFSDSSGRLWIGTSLGLAYRPAGSREIQRVSEVSRTVVTNIGMLSNGLLYALTTEGLTLVDPETLSKPVPPLIHIASFEANGTPFPVETAINLSSDMNTCTIEFAGITFRDEAGLRYQYKMAGVDREWRPPTSSSSVTFAELDPGDYLFEVHAITREGVISMTPASIRISIATPYWRTWWFMVLAATGAAGLVMTGYHYRVSRLLEIERVRVRIASDLHDDVGSTLTKISLHSELLQGEKNARKRSASLRRIGAMSRELVTAMSDTVWSIDARNDHVGDLVDRIRDVVSSLRETIRADIRVHAAEVLREKKLKSEVRQNVYLIFKEAVNNAVKHSGATRIQIRLSSRDHVLTMSVKDNGRGFSGGAKYTGHGMKNMTMRAERIGGTMVILGRGGTEVSLRVPIS